VAPVGATRQNVPRSRSRLWRISVCADLAAKAGAVETRGLPGTTFPVLATQIWPV